MMILAVFTQQLRAETKDIVDTAVAAGSFKTLATALQSAELVDALKGEGPFTVFAPTDEAFSALPEGTVETLLKPENKQQLTNILTYHVVSGAVTADQVVKLSGAKSLNGQQIDVKVQEGKVNVDNANVTTTDIACSNGVIHAIDSVLLPAADNIPTTAEKAGSFKTLLAAVNAAGLEEVLSGDAPLTVFAPTDEAFAKLPEGTLESLLKPESKAKLIDILKLHVVPGRVYSADAIAAGNAETLLGEQIKIQITGNSAKVNESTLTATDIDASNGVIHVIDSVLLPSDNKQTSVHPRQRIEQAISEGVPLYNAGHADACAEVYMTTVQNILEMEDHCICPSTRATMQVALNKAKHSTCPTTKAWTMRNAMNVAYRALSPVR